MKKMTLKKTLMLLGFIAIYQLSNAQISQQDWVIQGTTLSSRSKSVMIGGNSTETASAPFLIKTGVDNNITGTPSIRLQHDYQDVPGVPVQSFKWDIENIAGDLSFKFNSNNVFTMTSFPNETSLYFAKNIRFNSSNAVFVSGNFGIGVNTMPANTKFTVQGNSVFNGNLQLMGTASTILLGDVVATPQWGIEYQDGGLNFWKPYGSNNFGNHFLFIKDNGSVGIGTSNPVDKLEVNGGLKIGNTTASNAGTIRWTGSDFEGNVNGTWKSLVSGSNWIDNGTNTYITSGKVGIGINNTTNFPLLVRKDQAGYTYIASDNNNTPNTGVGSGFAITESGNVAWYMRGERDNSGKFNIGNSNGNKLTIDTYGNVGIGTTNPGTYKLAVNGSIHAKEIIVDLVGWSDFVFEKDYKLKQLSEVESYIIANKHLPDVPSALEVENNGANLGEMNKILLQKIEELTLYTIQLEKRMNELENK
jgi:hypothetical protein